MEQTTRESMAANKSELGHSLCYLPVSPAASALFLTSQEAVALSALQRVQPVSLSRGRLCSSVPALPSSWGRIEQLCPGSAVLPCRLVSPGPGESTAGSCVRPPLLRVLPEGDSIRLQVVTGWAGEEALNVTALGVGEGRSLNSESPTFKHECSSTCVSLATSQIEHVHLNYKPIVSAAYLDSSPACRRLY